jgi:trk/ktr system potassium uptake protein
MNYPLIARLLGGLLAVFSASLLVMIPFALWYGEWTELKSILESILIGGLFGGLLYVYGWKAKGELYRRESLAIVGLGWILTAGIGAMPFWIGGMVNNFTDAYFESMSGLTTTGSSILSDIESQAKCLLFWRSFLHFLGGIGIIVFFVAILPVLGVGGKALFKQEVPGPVPEGLTPRIKDTAIGLCKIYIILNIIETVILMLCGMSFFEAINHAMATMATGGFSTKNDSVGHFLQYSAAVEWTIIIFMFLAGTNFSLHLRFAKGDFLCFWKDAEFRVYLGVILGITILFSTVLYITGNAAVSNPDGINVRDSLFTTLAIITTTGFGTVDFNEWPAVCRIMVVLLMFIGGMAGSTAGGMKIIRWVILVKSSFHQLQSETMPRVVRVLKVGRQALDKRAVYDTFALFFLWISVFVVASTMVALLTPASGEHHEIVTSITAVAACLNNIGPGLEAVGPTMNFASQHDLVKWILSLCMVMGRLELYAILIILNPKFWLGR